MLIGIETKEGWKLGSSDFMELLNFHLFFTGDILDPLRARLGDGGRWEVAIGNDPMASVKSWRHFVLEGVPFEKAVQSFEMIMLTRPVAMKAMIEPSFFVSFEVRDGDTVSGKGILCEIQRKKGGSRR